MNNINLIGRLTRDPEISETQSQIKVAKFSIAVNRKFKNADGEYDADFINIVAWRNNADICYKYLKKGSQVGITGTLQIRGWDAEDGTKRYSTEVVAESVMLIGNKSESAPAQTLEPVDVSDLPF